jgi:hypothetical protein
MDSKSLEEELERLKTSLRTISIKYSEAITNRDRMLMSSCEPKINQLLEEIKIKSLVYEDLIK